MTAMSWSWLLRPPCSVYTGVNPPVLPRLAGALGLPPYHSWSYSHMALPQAAPAPASIFITLSRRFIVFIIVNYCKFID